MGKDYSQYITKKTPPEDKRNFFLRLLLSIRPTFGMKGKIDGKSGKIKHNITVGVKGGTDF
jgi:hypothetical protein